MTKKIFRSMILTAGAVLLASMVIIMGCLYEYFCGVQEQQLKDELSLAASAMERLDGQSYLTSLRSDRYRLTWVAADGTVLYDTQADAGTMENHIQRQEIQQALLAGHGESSRYSATLLEKTLYQAQRLNDGTVLRISISRATAGVLVLGMLQPFLVVLVVALALSALLARRLAQHIVKPLNELDLEHPLDNDTYEELSPLLGRINQQRRQIDAQVQELRRKQDEFEQITGSMKEGLVLLNEAGAILSINPAARGLFHTDAACLGQDFLTIERSTEVSHALETAMAQGHSEIHTERDGREYQLDISRIGSEGDVTGAVVLAFDVTEQALAQRNRREFTANVSHELKTPLQSIMGSAELMENGLVKPEDMPVFVGRIRSEAARLVTLIEDIIRLSQLDEGVELPTESVALRPLAEETVSSLHDAAAAKNVTLSVTGEAVTVRSVRRLLSEILYNLCDNAIKYNVPNGSVTVDLSPTANGAALTVSDTGIGIPPEHQSRVFERFYRVDKSHSRQSGGTGLGLSIVKHAVQDLGGAIHLDSTPGQGTSIRVTIPNKDA
mgnify:FL=1